MPGIYIHIPFCRKACSYCDFHFSTSLRLKQEVVDAICREATLRKGEFSDGVRTLYFGGGTPSLLGLSELEQLMETLNSTGAFQHLEEVTLEANPEDITDSKLQGWKALGINRLSIGTQSFFEADLRLMNRDHSPEQAVKGVKRAQDAGFENITIDLIYGIPGQHFTQWQENVERALALNTPHLSSYCLTIEPRTALHHAMQNGHFREKAEDAIEQEYLYLHQMLEDAGLEHYEISNFARTGMRARHNSSYWQGEAYTGLGPAAHSFDGHRERRWNIANNVRYIHDMKEGTLPSTREQLSASDRLNEVIMTSLRTRAGIDLNALERAFSPSETGDFFEQAASLPTTMREWVERDASTLKMRPEHWLKCDALVRELMV